MSSCGKLGSRIPDFDMSCRIRGAMEDSNVHYVLECPLAEQVWDGARKYWQWREVSFRSLEDWVVWMGEKMDLDEIEESMAWNLWTTRNNFVFGNPNNRFTLLRSVPGRS